MQSFKDWIAPAVDNCCGPDDIWLDCIVLLLPSQQATGLTNARLHMATQVMRHADARVMDQ